MWHDCAGGFLVNKRLCVVFAALMAVPGALLGHDKPQSQAAPSANPITASEKGLYSFISGAVVAAAQKMPEKNTRSNRHRRCEGLVRTVATLATPTNCSA